MILFGCTLRKETEMVKDQELNRLFQLYQSKQACEQELEAWRRWIEERIEELQEQRSVLVQPAD